MRLGSGRWRPRALTSLLAVALVGVLAPGVGERRQPGVGWAVELWGWRHGDEHRAGRHREPPRDNRRGCGRSRRR